MRLSLKHAGMGSDLDLDLLVASLEAGDERREAAKEKINRITENIVDNLPMDEQEMRDTVDSLQNRITEVLKESGIAVKKIHTVGEDLAQSIVDDERGTKEVMEEQDQFSVLKSAARKHDKFVREATEVFKEAANILGEDNPIMLLVFTLFVQVTIISIFKLVIGPVLPGILEYIITSAVLAPVTQEIAKSAAIENQYPYIFNSCINLIEIYSSISRMGLKPGLLVSAVPTALHFIETFIQKRAKEMADDEEVPAKAVRITMAIHILWNVIATVIPWWRGTSKNMMP